MLLSLRIFLPFAVAYLVSYVVRVINAVAGEPIAADVGLDPGDLGLLTSLFFAGFGLAQIPLGILIDRYGARRVEATVLFLLAGGAALFAFATDVAELAFARFLMGIGASMCLMAPISAFRVWFAPARLPLINGLHLAAGALGGVIGGGPADVLVRALGWRDVFLLIAGLVVLTAVAIWLVVPRAREPAGAIRLGAMAGELRTILSNRVFWRIAPLSATSQGAALAVGSLWTGPFLLDVAGLSSRAAANWLSVYALALVGGFVAVGWTMNRTGSLAGADRVVTLGIAAFVLVQGVIVVAPPSVAVPTFILYNVVSAAGGLTYALAVRRFAPSMAGRVNTALNFLVFLTAFLVQWLFGVVLSHFPDAGGGTAPAGYSAGFAILIGLQLAAFVPWFLLADRSARDFEELAREEPAAVGSAGAADEPAPRAGDAAAIGPRRRERSAPGLSRRRG